jgi:hypothetical protein
MKKIGSPFMKLVFIWILVLTVTFVPFVQAEGGSITVNVFDDAYVTFNSPNTNYGSEQTLNVCLLHCFTWLKFDLATIPEGAEGFTATLELYSTANGVTQPRDVVACLVQNNFNNTWTEETITASNMPYPNDTELDTEYVANNETRYEWNVTEAVKAAVNNNSTLLTIFMRFAYETEGNDISFKSKEGTLTQVPKLTVSWTATIPEYSLSIVPIAIVTTVAVLFLKKKHNRISSPR